MVLTWLPIWPIRAGPAESRRLRRPMRELAEAIERRAGVARQPVFNDFLFCFHISYLSNFNACTN